MSTIIPLDSPWAQVLAWTLVHFIWQGATIGLTAFLLLRFVRLTAAPRYAVGITALAVMLAAPVVTFVVLKAGPALAVQIVREPQVLGRSDGRIASNVQTLTASDSRTLLDPGTPAISDLRTLASSLIIVVWFVGVAALSVRLLGGWLVAQRLITRAVQPAAPEIRALARRLAGRLPLDRMVRLFESSAVAVPVTIGWLKPVVLLPAAAMTGLSMAQVEALLAHELAHVRRYDYLVNLLQSAVETLLFYHPAVWWASKLVRTEREHCCDDVAIKVCDRLVYVTALSDLAVIGTPRVVMAASSGLLLRRVRRILGATSAADQAGAGWLPAFVLMVLAGVFVPAALTSAPAAIQEARPAGVQSGVTGGVVGDVVGGVVGGVSGGVAGRSPEGSVGGIVGGIRAGIKGGVSGTVAGDVIGVARGVSQSAGEGAQKEDEIAKLENALKLAREQYERVKRLVEVGLESPQTLAEIEVELRRIERKIVAARQGGQLREQKEKIADLTAQLELARQKLERTNRLFAAGLVTASAVKEAEANATTTEIKLLAVRDQLQFREIEADLQRRQAARQTEIAELERVLREIGTSGQAGRRGTVEQQAKQGARSIDDALAEIEARRSDVTAFERDQRLLSSSAPIADTSETVRAGDLLVIKIAGEPDLPRVYVVADTGAIRLPLIGNVPVLGLTALQVREAVRRELTQRRLADDPNVTASLRRAR